MDIAFGTKLAKFKQMTQLLVYAMSTGPSAYCLGLFCHLLGHLLPTALSLGSQFFLQSLESTQPGLKAPPLYPWLIKKG